MDMRSLVDRCVRQQQHTHPHCPNAHSHGEYIGTWHNTRRRRSDQFVPKDARQAGRINPKPGPHHPCTAQTFPSLPPCPLPPPRTPMIPNTRRWGKTKHPNHSPSRDAYKLTSTTTPPHSPLPSRSCAMGGTCSFRSHLFFSFARLLHPVSPFGGARTGLVRSPAGGVLFPCSSFGSSRFLLIHFCLLALFFFFPPFPNRRTTGGGKERGGQALLAPGWPKMECVSAAQVFERADGI